MLAQLQAHIDAVASEQDDLDYQRGQRIKARREELHLTQPAVVELIEALAWQLPADHPLHPNGAEKAPVSLRGLQAWERGGGIVWEKAKLLARALRMDVDELMNGPLEPTPDPFPVNGQQLDMADALVDFTNAIAQQNELLRRQSEVLERIERALEAQARSTARYDESTERLLDAADEASQVLRDGTRSRAGQRQQTGR